LTTVPLDLPAWRPSRHDSPEGVKLDIKSAVHACDSKRKVGCVLLAYRLLHGDHAPTKEEQAQAEAWYRRGCTKDKSDEALAACLSLGYLLRKRNDPEADTVLRNVCLASQNDQTCWYRYVRWSDLPDPTLDAGEWKEFEKQDAPGKKENGTPAYGGLTAVGPGANLPFYSDFEVQGRVGPEDHDWFQFAFGLTIHVRAIRERMETGGTREVIQGGFGIEAGPMFRPFGTEALTFRVAVRGSIYGLNRNVLGVLATVGHAFGRHHFEAGILAENMPTDVHDVQVFGGTTTTEKQSVLPLVALRYAFLPKLR
jgi:hypothetical protein